MDSIYGFLHQYICFFVFFFQQKLFLWRAIFSTNHILSRQRYFSFCLNDSSWFFYHFFFRLLRLPNLLLTLISLRVVGRHGNTTQRLVAISFLCKLRKYGNYTETANNNCQGIISPLFYEKVDFSTIKYSFSLFMIKRLSACRLNFQCFSSYLAFNVCSKVFSAFNDFFPDIRLDPATLEYTNSS